MVAPVFANGQFPHEPHHAARLYLDRGVLPVPVHARSKRPINDSWQTLRVQAATLHDHFPIGGNVNVGLLLGPPSQNLIDVDLDAVEAVVGSTGLVTRPGC